MPRHRVHDGFKVLFEAHWLRWHDSLVAHLRNKRATRRKSMQTLRARCFLHIRCAEFRFTYTHDTPCGVRVCVCARILSRTHRSPRHRSTFLIRLGAAIKFMHMISAALNYTGKFPYSVRFRAVFQFCFFLFNFTIWTISVTLSIVRARRVPRAISPLASFLMPPGVSGVSYEWV